MNDEVTDEATDEALEMPIEIATDLREVALFAAESDDVGAMVASVVTSLQESLDFERVVYLEYLNGRFQKLYPREDGAADGAVPAFEVSIGSHPLLSDIFDSGRGTVVDGADALRPIRLSHLEDDPAVGIVAVPVRRGVDPIGLLVLMDPAGDVDRRTLDVATVFGVLLGLGVSAVGRVSRLEHLREVLQERSDLLSAELSSDADACHALERSVSRPMRRLVQMARQVAASDAPVLITGETGAGKEVLARAIHEWSPRADGPFVQLNCAALSDHLIESELFGHVKGAFSGAVQDRSGRFRVADGGTLLLDEIGEMPLEAQTKLLRVLETGEVLPVGADRTVPVDVRIIAATNVDLDLAIDRGSFREDLYFRLHVFPLHLPPLRERIDDLPVLVEGLLDRMGRRTGHGPWRVSKTTLDQMKRYSWPGNVRELVNALERARVFSPLGGTLKVEVGDSGARPGGRAGGNEWPTLDEHQRAYIEEVLEHTGGKIYGEGGAAELLEMPPSTLQSRIRRLGVDRP